MIGRFKQRRARHDDLDEEISSHLEALAKQHESAGLSPDEARFAARRDFGGVVRVREEYQSQRARRWLDGLRLDLRFAARSLLRAPGFTALAVLTLGLGIGANTAIFSAVNGVLLRPLPFVDADRLVMVWNGNTREGVDEYPMSPANLRDLQSSTQTIERVEAMYSFLLSSTLRLQRGTEHLTLAGMSPGMFTLLGRSAALGRTFDESDKRVVVVLSDATWRARFGADPSIVGREVTLDGQPAPVIGVMPPDFHFPLKSMLGPSGFTAATEPEGWVPIDQSGPQFVQNGRPVRAVHFLSVVGRLAPGASIGSAREEVSAIFSRLEADYPAENRGLEGRVVALFDQMVQSIRPALMLLLVGVGLALLMACVNVANLMLARAMATHRELAVRMAIGASRVHIIRQMLSGSVLMSLSGGAVGYAVAYAGVRLVAAMAPAEVMRSDQLAPDLAVFLFLGSASLATGLLVGIVPAALAMRTDAQTALREGSRGIAGGALHRRVRSGFVVAQVALAVILTLGAGLLLRSFVRILEVDPGFKPENLLTLQVAMPGRITMPDARRAFYRDLFSRLEAVSGVVAVGGTTRLPLGSTNVSTRVGVEGRDVAPADMPEVEFRRALHGYFEAMGIPLRRGRLFTDADGPGGPGVVLVNETMARRVWADEDAVGSRVRIGPNPNAPWLTVVGVVGDLRHSSLDGAPAPELYINYLQNPPIEPFLVVRTAGDPAELAEPVRAALKGLDADLAVYDMRTMNEVLATSVAFRRFLLFAGLFLGGLSLTLASLGIYGVMALMVVERTEEVGVRLALGAQPSQVFALIVREGTVLASVGVGLGLLGALSLMPAMQPQLFETSARDAATLTVVSVMFLLIAVTACLLPARRATHVDPLVAMRAE